MTARRKKGIKRLVNVCMTVLLLCLMAWQVTGETLHEWFGIGMTALLIIEYVLVYIRKKETAGAGCSFDITLTVGFILMVLAVSYGRGDSLTAYVGDSGNRVLLQVVPLIVMTYAGLFIGLIGEEQ